MYLRELSLTLSRYDKFPVLAILGPRQSGKTTLVQLVFPSHRFLSLEHPGTREFAEADPERFLLSNENKHGIIIDEFQYVPKLLSYIQLDVDAKKRKNYFVLTGSQNFLMNQAITQSLAGRVGILTLLPMSITELLQNKLILGGAEETVFKGGYPRIYNEQFDPEIFYSSYVHTYVERDVRQLVNVGDLSTFRKFLQLCAARVGNLINFADLATVCGIDGKTAKRWISILEASYIIFLLEPHFKNFNKRLTKTPKLYFYDTGLVCNLLRIPSMEHLGISPYWGPIFENFIVSDLAKQYFNSGSRPPIYFWRDKNGRLEIDCIVDEGGKLFPIEIKSGLSLTTGLFDNLRQWNDLAHLTEAAIEVPVSYLIYGGNEAQQRSAGTAITWKESASVVKKIKEKILSIGRG